MVVSKYISDEFPTVNPYEGVNVIEDKLLTRKYLVVLDVENKFYGILTPCDLIRRPHKIVIDCVSKKQPIYFNDTIQIVLQKFSNSESPALPVLQNNDFIGVVEESSLFKGLEIKITELYNESLISKKTKEKFLNNLYHEIRTPLNGIIGFLSIIASLDIKAFKDEGEETFHIVSKSADRFLLIMDDLIELSCLHAGNRITIRKSNVNINKIFSELKVYFDVLISMKNRNRSIFFTEPDNLPIIYTDGQKLKHILYHLIDNAVKFSKNDVKYGCTVHKETNSLMLFVTNVGNITDAEGRTNIFDFFEKQDFVESEFNTGLGIGLSLVKKLTEALKGKVSIENNNNTTTFKISIPLYS